MSLQTLFQKEALEIAFCRQTHVDQGYSKRGIRWPAPWPAPTSGRQEQQVAELPDLTLNPQRKICSQVDFSQL